MKNTLKMRLYAGFTVAILAVIGGGIFTYITFKKQRTQAEWVEHSYEVITNAQRINRYVYEIESATTAYRNTHVFKYLDPYFEIHPKVLPAFYDLRKLVMDNPSQLKRTIGIEKELIHLLNYWEALDMRHDTLHVFSHEHQVTMEERNMLTRVHADLQEMIVEERLLLSTRNGANSASVTRASIALVLNSLLILLVAVALGIISVRELRSRLKAQIQLRSKLRETELLNDQANANNWLLTGMSLVNESLQGDAAIEALAYNNLQAIVNYLGLPAGAFYCYEPESQVLNLCAGKGLPSNVKKSFALHEGLIGEAATQKELTTIRNIPATYWQLESSSGNNLPGTIVCLPLWHDNDMVGLIELVCFTALSDSALELLRNTAHAIAVAVNAAGARKKVMELLRRLQEQKEILETQQEELRQSNEELTRQSEILQASEEELRVQEEELRQINDEMNVQNKALEITRQELSLKAEELEQSSTYKSEFLANMSHELRTPLNSVLILARLLEENKDQNLTPKQMEYAGIIHKSGSDLLKLINDILDLSKIEAGKVEMNIEPVAVKGINNDLVQLFDVVADEKQINFITEIDTNVPVNIQTDGQRLEQVIKNLLSNAFKFTPADGTIKLRWSMQDDGLHIAVSDTGTGIPADKQQLIFEAFRQADGSTSRKYGGTGLGLSISKELMKRLGGEIRLQSEEGKGSTFTIVMQTGTGYAPAAKPQPAPVVQEAPVVIREVVAPDEQLVEDDRNTLGKKDKLVLIIEDDMNFAGILRDFARQKGFKTIVALNGNDGLFFARKFLPAAIILDMNLPLIDGNSILKILKNNDELKHILVHVVSAGEISLQVRDKIEGYTQKPLQVTDLETVFSGISQQLEDRLKKVLVISDGVLLHHPFLQSLSDERQLQTQYHLVKNLAEAALELQSHQYDGLVLDAGTDIAESIARLNQLKQISAARDLPVIIYLDHDISEADELALKKNAAAIVRNSTFSGDRLMDELELFLYKLSDVQQPADRAPRTETSLVGQKILLADDDMRNVFSLSALLAGNGIDVVTAADGKEALERLDENPDIRLVLMDIMMPEMDGYEAMRRIRANARYKDLPVIALTAKAMAGDREKCIAAGASDYIAKPIDSSKLLSLMHVWMV